LHLRDHLYHHDQDEIHLDEKGVKMMVDPMMVENRLNELYALMMKGDRRAWVYRFYRS
jgi:hypothetical protein